MTATMDVTPEAVRKAVRRWRGNGQSAIEILRRTKEAGIPSSMVEQAIRDEAEVAGLAKLIGSNDVPVEIATHSGVGFAWGSGEKKIAVLFGRIFDLSNVAGARAEVTIEVGAGEERLVAYGPVVINTMKSAEISGIARDMADLLPVVDQMLWQKYLWDACRLAVLRHRQGLSEGGTVLRPQMRLARDKAAIEGLLTARTPTLLFALPGQGKSYLALAAALTMSGADCGGLPFLAPDRRRVLYLDWETEESDQNERLYHLAGPDARADIGYKKMAGTFMQNLDGILAMIDAHSYDYLIIDSLLEASGNLIDDTAVASFKSAVGETNCGSLWLAHTPKNGQGETAFGSIHWMGQARLAWLLEQKDSDPDVLAFSLTCKKDSDRSFRGQVDLSCRFVRGSAAVWSEGLVPKSGVNSELIARMVDAGQSTVQDLMRMTGLSDGVLKERLSALEAQGRVRWSKDGWVSGNGVTRAGFAAAEME